MSDKIKGPSHAEGQVLLAESAYGQLESEIWAIKQKQNEIQKHCIHPDTHLQSVDRVYYHPSPSQVRDYWTDFHCYQCDTQWRVDRPDPMESLYNKIRARMATEGSPK